MPNLTAIGPGPNGTTHVKDETGRDIFLTPGNAQALEANGTLAPSGGAQVGLTSPWTPGPAASGGASVSMASPWTPGAPEQRPPQQQQPLSGGLPPALPDTVASTPSSTIYASDDRKRSVTNLARRFGSPDPEPADESKQTGSIVPVTAPKGRESAGASPNLQAQVETVWQPGRKAGWKDHSRSSQGISEDEQKQLLDSNRRMLISEQKTAAERADLERVNIENQKVQAINDGYKAKSDADRWGYLAAKKDEYIQTKAAELEQKNKELAGTTVDRGRYWKDRGWVGSLLSALSVGAYELGKAKGGNQGPNLVTEMINRGIDRDIDNQVTNLTKRRSDINAQQDTFDRHIANSSEEAKLEQKAAMQLAAANELRAQTLDEKLHYLSNDAEMAAQALEKEAFGTQAKVMGMRQHQASQIYDRGSSGGWVNRETLPSQRAGQELAANARNAKNQEIINGPNGGGKPELAVYDQNGGLIGYAPTKEAAKEANDLVFKKTQLDRYYEGMTGAIDHHGSNSNLGFRDADDKNKYQTNFTGYTNLAWGVQRPGDAPSGPEKENFDKAHGGNSLNNYFTGDQEKTIEGAHETNVMNIEDRVQQITGTRPNLRQPSKRQRE